MEQLLSFAAVIIGFGLLFLLYHIFLVIKHNQEVKKSKSKEFDFDKLNNEKFKGLI